MAQKVQVLLEDDITGEQADETVKFGLDGTGYEIDLTAANAAAMRAALRDFVSSARKVTIPGRNRGGRGAAPQNGGQEVPHSKGRREKLRDVRAYFEENPGKIPAGMTLKERGRMPEKLEEIYDKRFEAPPVVLAAPPAPEPVTPPEPKAADAPAPKRRRAPARSRSDSV